MSAFRGVELQSSACGIITVKRKQNGLEPQGDRVCIV